MRTNAFELLALAVVLGAEGESLTKLAQCGRGEAAACGKTEWSLSMAGPASGWKKGDLTDLVEIACTGGDTHVCDRLATNLITGRSGEPQRAMAIWARLCEAGSATACSKGGDSLRLGLGVSRDSERSHAWTVRGCTLKDPQACTRLYKFVPDVPDLSLGETEWMEDACAKGSTVSCLDSVVPSQRPALLDATNQQCESRRGDACFALLREAYSYPEVRTEALLDRTCRAGRKSACAMASAIRQGAVKK